MSRRCVKCGNLHGMYIENVETGECVEELDLCRDCIFSECKIKDDALVEAAINASSEEELKKIMKQMEDEIKKYKYLTEECEHDWLYMPLASDISCRRCGAVR